MYGSPVRRKDGKRRHRRSDRGDGSPFSSTYSPGRGFGSTTGFRTPPRRGWLSNAELTDDVFVVRSIRTSLPAVSKAKGATGVTSRSSQWNSTPTKRTTGHHRAQSWVTSRDLSTKATASAPISKRMMANTSPMVTPRDKRTARLDPSPPQSTRRLSSQGKELFHKSLASPLAGSFGRATKPMSRKSSRTNSITSMDSTESSSSRKKRPLDSGLADLRKKGFRLVHKPAYHVSPREETPKRGSGVSLDEARRRAEARVAAARAAAQEAAQQKQEAAKRRAAELREIAEASRQEAAARRAEQRELMRASTAPTLSPGQNSQSPRMERVRSKSSRNVLDNEVDLVTSLAVEAAVSVAQVSGELHPAFESLVAGGAATAPTPTPRLLPLTAPTKSPAASPSSRSPPRASPVMPRVSPSTSPKPPALLQSPRAPVAPMPPLTANSASTLAVTRPTVHIGKKKHRAMTALPKRGRSNRTPRKRTMKSPSTRPQSTPRSVKSSRSRASSSLSVSGSSPTASVLEAKKRIAEARRAEKNAQRDKESEVQQAMAARLARRQAHHEDSQQKRAEIYALNKLMRAWGNRQMKEFSAAMQTKYGSPKMKALKDHNAAMARRNEIRRAGGATVTSHDEDGGAAGTITARATLAV